MKKQIITVLSTAILVSACGPAVTAATTYVLSGVSTIMFNVGGPDVVREWANFDGRFGQQSLVNYGSTALDLWPTGGTKAVDHSTAELTIHRTRWDDPAGMERFNISAMVHADGAAYRFGVERQAPGQFRDMIFCFEDVTPGVSNCPFKITMTGVYISDDSGQTWRKL